MSNTRRRRHLHSEEYVGGDSELQFSPKTPEAAFQHWKRLVQAMRQSPKNSWVASHFPTLEQRYLQDPSNQINKAAFLGAVAGLVGPVDPHGHGPGPGPHTDQDYRRIAGFVGEYANGPQELTLYITDRCNFRCTFDGVPCMRETGSTPGTGVPHHGEMDFKRVEQTLDRWPSIRSICIAGFGEPLLYKELLPMIHRLQQRNLFVGLITNGALLGEKVASLQDALLACPGHYVSVSLNATNSADHEEMSKTKTWEKVLDGITAAAAAGLNTGISFVCTRHNLDRVPELLQLAKRIGVRFVDLLNVLPHAGSSDLNFRLNVITDRDAEAIEQAKRLDGAELVRSWPTPVNLDLNENPHQCMSPFVSVGIDASGFVTACRRVEPPNENHPDDPHVWTGDHFVDYRLAVTGDRDPPDGCKACFGNWKG